MADYLLVVDMQSDYVAVGKAYHEELTAAVNDKLLPILANELSIFSIVFSGREKIERRNLRPACCLYLLVFLKSVGLLALLIQI